MGGCNRSLSTIYLCYELAFGDDVFQICIYCSFDSELAKTPEENKSTQLPNFAKDVLQVSVRHVPQNFMITVVC